MLKERKIILSNPNELELPEITTGTGVTNQAKVILFNDEWHSFEEVIYQIIKAINCSMDHAENLTWQVHNNGKALVYSGELEECLRISAVLEEIRLHTKIEF